MKSYWIRLTAVYPEWDINAWTKSKHHKCQPEGGARGRQGIFKISRHHECLQFLKHIEIFPSKFKVKDWRSNMHPCSRDGGFATSVLQLSEDELSTAVCKSHLKCTNERLFLVWKGSSACECIATYTLTARAKCRAANKRNILLCKGSRCKSTNQQVLFPLCADKRPYDECTPCYWTTTIPGERVGVSAWFCRAFIA